MGEGGDDKGFSINCFAGQFENAQTCSYFWFSLWGGTTPSAYKRGVVWGSGSEQKRMRTKTRFEEKNGRKGGGVDIIVHYN